MNNADIVDIEIKDGRYEELRDVCRAVKSDCGRKTIGDFVRRTMGKYFLENGWFMKELEKSVVSVFSTELVEFLK